MCSIPGLPTPGSEVPVFITKVNLNPNHGLVEFWVNIRHEKKLIYAQMKEEIQIPKRKFDGCEGKPADLCLVCIRDTWHRARIVSSQNETYNVFLIDQGQPHTTTSEALAWGQSDSFLLPPEIESCILANIVSLEDVQPERATKCLNSLCGRTSKGLVQHVLMPDRIILLDIPVVSSHMCKLGVAKKVPADEFKCFVQERLHFKKGVAPEVHINASLHHENKPQYFYPELLIETFVTVQVTEVKNPHSFFCKIHIFTKAVKLLSEQIHQQYEASSDFKEAQPQAYGDPCAARGKNGRWYRSSLKENMKSDGTVEVLHVDEGKTELVPVKDIKPLNGEFLKKPIFTYRCSLNGVENNGKGWTAEQTDYLKSLLLNQTVVAKLNSHNVSHDAYNVTLYTPDGECINDTFTEKTGLQSLLKTEQGSEVPTVLSFLCSHRDEKDADISKNTINVDDLQKETLPRAKDIEVDGRGDDDTLDVIDIRDSSEHSDHVMPRNSHHQAGFHHVAQNVNDVHDVHTEGRSIHVKVTSIESLKKFWCQKAENSDSLLLLMQNLQNYYASDKPEPLVESICVARNPDNNMWYRARIITSSPSPVVDVRFIDYGQTQKVPLQDIRPIDPVFLRLHAQAFQCSLFDLKNPTTVSETKAALEEFIKFVGLSALSNAGLKCIVKAVTSDEEGLPLSLVDIEASSESVCKLVAQKLAEAESAGPNPQEVQSDAYNYSTHNIDIGAKETVLVTSSDSVNHFYCQLRRNSGVMDKLLKNVKQLVRQSKSTDHPLRLHSICFAKYTDNQWYRGEVVEVTPKLKVHFVDYGDILMLNKSDVCPFPTEASIARSTPVQAVPLGLHDIPTEVPLEINQWFADNAVGFNFTISVVKKDAKGKLIVELFHGSRNINKLVREKINMTQPKVSKGLAQQTNQQLSTSSVLSNVPNGNCSVEELMTKIVSPKMAEGERAEKSNGMCPADQLNRCSKSMSTSSPMQVQHEISLEETTLPTLDVILEISESVLAETLIQSDSKSTSHSPQSCPDGFMDICRYKRPNLSLNMTAEVYATCIVGPNYFWCQYAYTEDLDTVSKLAQDAGREQQDTMFAKSLDTGSSCLALFSDDNQWYRAQVIKRNESSFNVLFIDYGNESDVDIKNVSPPSQGLLDAAPQAFLCSLDGFDESLGSWDDNAFDDFYNLLLDKRLRVTVSNVAVYSETMASQYAVQVLCDNRLVNELMQQYWTAATDEHDEAGNAQIENSIQDSKTEFKPTHLNFSQENVNVLMYKKPNVTINKDEQAYASCIAEPNYFWCQYTNTEELDKISSLSQEAGQVQQDSTFPQTLAPGSPCLALFSADEQWYRAQVIDRVDDTFNVFFVDYGNESGINVKDVRPLPQNLLDMAPQAFLCSLDGFDLSKGSWDDQVFDDFYNALVDKPLKLKVLNTEDHPGIHVSHHVVEVESEGVLVNTAVKKYWKTSSEESFPKKSPQTETSLQEKSRTEPETTPLRFSEKDINTCMYKEPKVSESETEMVYASCIAEPHYFWCQHSNTEELNKMSQLAQEAGQELEDTQFPDTLGPGSPCLALFSSDNQWYRAQIIKRNESSLHVLFIDYGNESDVDIKNVRPPPQSLLDAVPQAFLCSLHGFVESRGSWDDRVYDDFYGLLVDKPLKLTVLSKHNHAELAVPQFEVQVECDGVLINKLMENYWKGQNADHTSLEGVRSADRMKGIAEA
ncbi:tudor domain-containing protein 6 [Xyrichtys novacula]|uniref:Tudor domain-containing protein 6 n=1 Tax=Xyrichtys novacula TaxID=13765 RepID=A0AAV1GKX6_XYRNO|nr:tudor domain-containing protein 6 [Xyrichtys novacula]